MSAMLVKTYRKTVVERRRLYLDYSCWLAESEVLTDFQVTIAPFTEGNPLVVSTSYPDAGHKKLMMYVSGGKANTDYTLQMVASTNEGQIKRDDIGIKVAP